MDSVQPVGWDIVARARVASRVGGARVRWQEPVEVRRRHHAGDERSIQVQPASAPDTFASHEVQHGRGLEGDLTKIRQKGASSSSVSMVEPTPATCLPYNRLLKTHTPAAAPASRRIRRGDGDELVERGAAE
jgi:hypothetical protein